MLKDCFTNPFQILRNGFWLAEAVWQPGISDVSIEILIKFVLQGNHPAYCPKCCSNAGTSAHPAY